MEDETIRGLFRRGLAYQVRHGVSIDRRLRRALAAIEAAGFRDISLTPVYMDQEVMAQAAVQLDLGKVIDTQDERFQKAIYSAKVVAFKPK